MPNKYSTFSTYFERGKSGKIGPYEDCLSNLGIYFKRFRYDYIAKYFYMHPDMAVGLDDELGKIAATMGYHEAKDEKYHIPIVGYTYSGKTILAHLIHKLSRKKGLNTHLLRPTDFQNNDLKDIVSNHKNADVLILDDAWQIMDILQMNISDVRNAFNPRGLITLWKPQFLRLEDYGESVEPVWIRAMDNENCAALFKEIWKLISVPDAKECAECRTLFLKICKLVGNNPGTSIKIFVEVVSRFCKTSRDSIMEIFEAWKSEQGLDNMAEMKMSEMRREILRILLTSENGRTPSEIADILGKDPATVIYHLKEMTGAKGTKYPKLVVSLKSGKNVFYRVNPMLECIAEMLVVGDGNV